MKKTRKEEFGNVVVKFGKNDFAPAKQETQRKLALSEKCMWLSIVAFVVWAVLAVFGSSIFELIVLVVAVFGFRLFVVWMKSDIATKKNSLDRRFQFLSLLDGSEYVTCLFPEQNPSDFCLLVDRNGLETRWRAKDVADEIGVRKSNIIIDKSVASASERTHKLVLDMSKKCELKFSAIPRGSMFS